ncbi:MAG: DUF4157 domain-containing protein [Sciscionella sp.]
MPSSNGALAPDTVLALQRTIGNAAVARLLAGDEEAEPTPQPVVQHSPVHRALRDPGRPLDGDVRSDMEARLGVDFSDVRVHTDSTAHAAADSVQAHAFTSGPHIVFQRGRYDTSSAPGRRMLAHELAHVIQQRSGPVDGAETADGLGLRVSDPGDCFEQEAQATAIRVMSALPDHDGPARTTPVASEPAGFAGPVPVARLMTEEDFRAATADRGPRVASDVTRIDEAVRAYHQTTREQYQQRAEALSTIIGRCRDYVDSSRNDRRKAGVQRLLSQALAEVEAYRAMAESETQQNPVEKFRWMAHALDITLLHERTEPETADELLLLDIPSKLQKLAASISRPSEFRQLAQDNVSLLQGLLTRPGLPTETVAVLNEILSYVDQISFEGGAPQGTTLTNRSSAGAPPQKYTFRAAMGHGGGSAERAGYFAHEMTHVAAHEAFDNTALMLLFPPDIQDDELRDLIQRRADTVDQLRTAFEANQAAFTPTQQSLIESKLTYGSSPTRVQHYIANFQAAGKIDQATVDRISHWVTIAGDRTGLMVEYDTVLNQMLVYLQLWGIDPSNAFYVRLRQAAQAALDYRNAARAATTAAGSSSQAPAPSSP